MALYMILDTEADKTAMEDAITGSMGLPTAPDAITRRWNEARQRLDGKWVLLWPGNRWVPPDSPTFTIEEHDPAWFPSGEPGELPEPEGQDP